MKFNYNSYRPRRLIQDIRRVNNNYFHSSDVRVTPLTKIGDAIRLHKEQTGGKIPTLERRLKPSQLTIKPSQLRRPTTKIEIRMPAEPSLASAHKSKASFIPALREYLLQVPSILQFRKLTLPLAILGLLVLSTGTIGGIRLISEIHGTQQANLQEKNNLNQDDPHATANSTSKNHATPVPNKHKPGPPTTPSSQQNQDRGIVDKTDTSNSSYENNYTSESEDNSTTSTTPDSSSTLQNPDASTNITSTEPPAPAASPPPLETNLSPSGNNPTSTMPVNSPVMTDQNTNDPSAAPATGEPSKPNQTIFEWYGSRTSP